MELKYRAKYYQKQTLPVGSVFQKHICAQKKIEQLGYLFDKYHEQLFNIISNKKWYVRVHNYLAPSLSPIEMDEEKVKKYDSKKSEDFCQSFSLMKTKDKMIFN